MPEYIYRGRAVLLKNEVMKRGLDCLLVTKDVNVSYLSGFRGHDAVALITGKKNYLLVDSRYIEEAKSSVEGFDVRLVKDSTFAAIERIVSGEKLKNVGFESTNLSYYVASRLRKFVRCGKLRPARDLVEGLRSIKDAEEIALINRSIRLTMEVFGRLIGSIRPGVSEKILAARAEIDFIKNGARPAFGPIIAIDKNSSRPHASVTHRKILKNSVAMVDMGCVLDGYCSDMTWMIATGKLNGRIRKIYDIVRAAQELAINAIKPGVISADIDAIARGYITDNGFGKYFGHALGHGVGMEVHESPSISASADGALRAGMVFTVEPAVYIPGFCGVRIEDMVLVTEKGFKILSN